MNHKLQFILPQMYANVTRLTNSESASPTVGFLASQIAANTSPSAWAAQAMNNACTFLLGVQRSDGGWGESYLSCQNKARFVSLAV